MDEDKLLTQEENDFNRLHKACQDHLREMQTDETKRGILVEKCKTHLKELEMIIEQIEKNASLAQEDRKLQEASAKGYRNRYQELIISVMKADGKNYQADGQNNGYTFTSDMISEEQKAELQAEQAEVEDISSEDLEPNPEEVRDMQRNFNLEHKLIIGAGVILFVFLVAFFLLLYVF